MNSVKIDAPMISVQDGQLPDFKIDKRGRGIITARGAPTEADHFAITGQATLELWYDRQRVWSKLKATSWDGSLIEYRKS